ncbi:inovirus Gp2 family protein [Vibrio natriegens]|uniref:inovirus Gp2 family protein n=1 Tax=Vibrio natriegens TaxID=691 RepID=UPI001EFEA944|nr:inovirus Gp2 family protein [Vibrio natriegens]MCG9702997.1 inovirus Gp2 family protein [Vibrio natriegens]
MKSKHFTLHDEKYFQGYQVYTDRGPLVTQYLERAFDTVHRALQCHSRTLAIRVDLHLPDTVQQYDTAVIHRFFKSLKEQIKHNRNQALKRNPHAHQTDVRYVWCKEQGVNNKPHYHVLLLLNAYAFNSLGDSSSVEGNNMATRIKKAWLSALGYHSEEDRRQKGTLVHFCEDGVYRINAHHDDGTLAKVLYRLSYLCKADSKNFAHHQHQFGRSNR